jgi:hypothetical protein
MTDEERQQSWKEIQVLNEELRRSALGSLAAPCMVRTPPPSCACPRARC